MLRHLALCAMVALPGAGLAQVVNPNPNAARNSTSQESRFVEANILAVFYHELGHAVIDIEDVPIFGQEEDAADVFSVYLIDALFKESSAQTLAYEAAHRFLADAEMANQGSDHVTWSDTHGPDEQRYFNTVCLFYGANPKAREAFATDLDLPKGRAAFCPAEYEQADSSWGVVLKKIMARGAGDSLRFKGSHNSKAAEILIGEIEELNAEMRLSHPLNVTVEHCGEANAFYDSSKSRIIFCSELETHLRKLSRRLY